MSYSRGFTLMEILVVVIIISILAMIAVPQYSNFLKEGSVQSARNNLVSIYNAQKTDYLNTGGYYTSASNPDTIANINTGLGLNITDTNFNYYCSNAGGFTCTATNIADSSLILTVTNNPIVYTGGVNCASYTGSACNPACQTDIPAYCSA